MAQKSTLRPRKIQPVRELQFAEASCTQAATDAPIPIWGGVECTLNRVGDAYFDQSRLSGHADRVEDFETISALGIRTLRFGLLWELSNRHGSPAWADSSMLAMRRAGIRPIVGLLHHGSGPPDTSLIDPDFPEQLAMYAGAIAERYPEVDAYTPVNEPNTTARFSAQYGLWYPHHRSTRSFLQALLNQVRGTVLSMEAVRKVRPDAQLIQTDDCGSIRATAELAETAALLQARQWLTYDLLFGRVDRAHPMFAYMTAHGIPDREILWFLDHPCPPDVVGLNYYTTSDRYLDHRLWLYPDSLRSSEGPFVDVEAVRVEGCEPVEVLRPVMDAWSRYGHRIALTEVHLGGSVEEQIRWLAGAYQGMQAAQKAGVQCESLTIWALLGSFFWNELVTRDNGYYEPGVFDVRSGAPMPTALAEVVSHLTRGHVPNHPALAERGWWQREDRTCYPWSEAPEIQAA